jgi:hypothetical protein
VRSSRLGRIASWWGSTGLWQGSSSYHVFQKEQPLREGFYDERFVTRERVSIEAAPGDLNEFFSKLWRDHPKPLPNVSETDFRELQKQTIAGVIGAEARADSSPGSSW